MKTLGTIFFKTRSQARSFAAKAKKTAPATKDLSVDKWVVAIK